MRKEEMEIGSIFKDFKSMEGVAAMACPQPQEPEPCPTCDGQGTVDAPGTTDGTQMDCPPCGGRGEKQI